MNTNITFSFLGFLFIILSYLIGSIPTGVWYSLISHKIDVRNLGSGNSGSTNVGRNFGFKAGAMVALIDVFKGWFPVFLAKLLFSDQPLVVGLVALACVIGHAFPVFADFRGGKIVASSIGILLAFNFGLGIVQVICLFAILYITSTMSFSALLSYGAASLYIIISNPYLSYKLAFLLIFVLMVIRHKDNIHRLRLGRENFVAWGLAYHDQLGFLDPLLEKVQNWLIQLSRKVKSLRSK